MRGAERNLVGHAEPRVLGISGNAATTIFDRFHERAKSNPVIGNLSQKSGRFAVFVGKSSGHIIQLGW